MNGDIEQWTRRKLIRSWAHDVLHIIEPYSEIYSLIIWIYKYNQFRVNIYAPGRAHASLFILLLLNLDEKPVNFNAAR